jgi:hypothetical protein
MLSRRTEEENEGLCHKVSQSEIKFHREIQGLMRTLKVFQILPLSNFVYFFEQLCVITCIHFLFYHKTQTLDNYG